MCGYKTKDSRLGEGTKWPVPSRMQEAMFRRRREEVKSWHLLENGIMQPSCPAKSGENFIYYLVAVFSSVIHCATFLHLYIVLVCDSLCYIVLNCAELCYIVIPCATLLQNFIFNLVAVFSRATLKFSQHCIGSKTPSSLCSIVIDIIITVIAVLIITFVNAIFIITLFMIKIIIICVI